ncbi:MAG: TetR/AcrR family transcriptional regulator [Cyclobacteriaceae bacterium]
MNNTRQIILDKAKDLFNSNGIQTTTLRQIALALNISQGNLNYHFKAKQDITEALYFELVHKMDAEMDSLTQQFSLLSTLYQSAEKTIRIFYQYRFLMRDMYLIFRESEKIKSHYINLQQIRRTQFNTLFSAMLEHKILRQEEFANEYARLYERLNILGDNWINAFELFKIDQDDPIRYYHNLLFETIYPYLTDTGKNQFAEIYN